MGKFSSRDLGNRARPVSYEHIEICTKERVVRRDLGNRASQVDQAHMNRTLVISCCCFAEDG